jgi:hypothetical protein
MTSSSPLFADLVLQVTGSGVRPGQSGNSKTIEFDLNILDLVSLGSVLLVNIDSFPIDSVLFATDSGYYVAVSLHEELTKLGLVVPTSRAVIDDESEAAALEVNSMRDKMAASMLIIEELREKATVYLNDAEATRNHVNKCSRSVAFAQVRCSTVYSPSACNVTHNSWV